MSRSRRRGSRSRQRSSSPRNSEGVVAGNLAKSISARITSASVCDVVSPANRRCPVSISNRTTPKAQTSVRLSTPAPVACSGLMYAAVPMTIPARVAPPLSVAESASASADAASSALARPKSSSLMRPSGSSLMFAGLRSRWMMPCSWATSSASAICEAVRSASVRGKGPCLSRSERSIPSTSSMTSALLPLTSSRPYTAAIEPWLSEAST